MKKPEVDTKALHRLLEAQARLQKATCRIPAVAIRDAVRDINCALTEVQAMVEGMLASPKGADDEPARLSVSDLIARLSGAKNKFAPVVILCDDGEFGVSDTCDKTARVDAGNPRFELLSKWALTVRKDEETT